MQRSSKRRLGGRLAAMLLPAALLALFSVGGWAQQVPSADQMQQLLQQRQGAQGTGSGPMPAVPDILMQPSTPQRPEMQVPDSRLEKILSTRAGVRLRQFGYDRFGQGQAVVVSQTGAVQDDYVLGPGDEIVVSLRGQENNEIRVAVDRNGQVVLPRLNPVPASGRSFSSFRQDVETAVRRAYVATSAFVSIGRVRQISVLVTGEVNNPGQRLVTGLSSAVDALMLSGGVKKSGSLRNIRILRNGHTLTVDLYNVLTGSGGTANLRLADGDRIVVPPLGRTAAVSGMVRLPGIYELGAGQSSIAVRALLKLAGGQEVRGSYRMSVLRIQPDGQSDMMALAGEGGVVRDSEILFVQLGADQTTSRATLSGGGSLAGPFAVASQTRLSEFVRAPGALGNSPYTLFGIVSRRNPRNLMRELVPFTPVAVLNGNEDSMLQGDDIVRPISVSEAQMLTNAVCTYLTNEQKSDEALRNPTARDISDFGNTNSPTNNGSGNAASRSTTTVPAVGQSDATDTSHGESYRGCSQNEGSARVFASQTQSGQINSAVQRPLVDQFGDTLPQYYVPQPLTVAQQQFGANNGVPQQQQQSGFGNGFSSPVTTPESVAADLPQPAPFAFPSDQMRRDQAQGDISDTRAAEVGKLAGNREVTRFADMAHQLGVTELVLVNFLIDHQVVLNGAVRGPGRYFVGPSVNLPDLVLAAGGAANWADTSAVEVISTAVDSASGRAATNRATLSKAAGTYASYVVRPQDVFRFNPVYTQNDNGVVTVQGEVRNSGTFQIRRGEHLSELLLRAGGLTGSAYPYGTVFLRKSVANMEHESFLRAAKETEDQLIVAMTRVGSDKISPDTFSAMQGFITDLRSQKALGRISIAADPSVLAAHPDLDPLLEPGDVIYIPQRPSTVSVLGQVRQPGSYPFRSRATIGDYIARAGGYSPTAETSGAYIVLPDGSARKMETSWLSFTSADLPPGSAIVVPRDVTPLDLRQIIIDTSQIFSQLAVSIASVAVISR